MKIKQAKKWKEESMQDKHQHSHAFKLFRKFTEFQFSDSFFMGKNTE
jgi:hypothetical protein